MTRPPPRLLGAGGPGRPSPVGEAASLAAVRRSDELVDRLAHRHVGSHDDGSHDDGSRAGHPDGTAPEHARPDDALVRALDGWVATIDDEVMLALAARGAVLGRTEAAAPVGTVVVDRPDPAGEPVRAAVAAGSRTGRPVASRLPWRVVSASAAAVIAVLAVGVGLQDAAHQGPGARTVAESVESVEATLVASMLAAESGDVAGARVLLEQARSLVAALPEDQRVVWETALGHTERGLLSAEAAIRSGRPVPDLVGLVPGASSVVGAEGYLGDVGLERLGRPDPAADPAGTGDRPVGDGAQAGGNGNGNGNGNGGGNGNGDDGAVPGAPAAGGSGDGQVGTAPVDPGTTPGRQDPRPDRGVGASPETRPGTPAATRPTTPRGGTPARPTSTPSSGTSATPEPTAVPESTAPPADRPTGRPTDRPGRTPQRPTAPATEPGATVTTTVTTPATPATTPRRPDAPARRAAPSAAPVAPDGGQVERAVPGSRSSGAGGASPRRP
ncbi:hypothetical protein [Jannaschia sp. R86511]|uniref:hypothetical protein n=1 Tax=Jannaschia sp. R86511 TaxID=3093853 RepID=UPI0036D2FD34